MALKQAALSGVRWTLAARAGMHLVTWPITILVMRLLEPGDYGVFAIALLVSGFITLFSELGLGVALVQAPDLSEPQTRMACTLMISLNAAIALLIIALAPLIAVVFEEPGVAAVMQVLTLELLIVAMAAVPLALMERGLRFKQISLGHLAGGVAGSVVMLGAALMDTGVWALVAGALTCSVVRSTAWVVFHGQLVRPGRLSLRAMRPMVKVSGHVLATRFLWYWSGQADQLVLGRLLHASALGVYSVSAQLAMLPAGKVMEAVNRVAFPILARLQSGSQGLQLAHRNVAALLALYGFGVCWGMAAVAPEFVGVVLGDKWLKAVYPLTMLSLVAPLRMLCAFNNTVVTAIGKPQAATYEQVLAAALLPLAVGVGAYLDGLTGAALAWILAFPSVFLYSGWLTAQAINMSQLAALRAVAAPAIAGLCMMAAVWGCRAVLGEVTPQGPRLAAGIVCGAATYLGVLWVIARPLLVDAWTLASDLLRTRAAR
jgi:O-antigen/teichoic acid export membrane protein